MITSIRNIGVKVPIIVTEDMVIVSGNQRVRACKELGIKTICGEIEHYDSEKDVVRDLIEINVRQRGIIADESEIKAGRRFAFLEDYYGIRQGGNHGNQYTKVDTPNNSVLAETNTSVLVTPNNSSLANTNNSALVNTQSQSTAKTQSQIAAEAGISVDTLRNYIKLSKMIPEMQDLVTTKIVSPTTALAIIKRLPEDDQRELARKLIGEGKKVSQSDVVTEICRENSATINRDDSFDEIEGLRAEIEELKSKSAEKDARISSLSNQVASYQRMYEPIVYDLKSYQDFSELINEGNSFLIKFRNMVNSAKFTESIAQSKQLLKLFNEFCEDMADAIKSVDSHMATFESCKIIDGTWKDVG